MVLVEADPVIAEPVQQLPGVEMLLIGAHRRPGIEMPLRQRVGQFGLAAFQMVEIGVIGQQIEDEDFHATSPTGPVVPGGVDKGNSAVATAAISANRQALRNTCRGASPWLN